MTDAPLRAWPADRVQRRPIADLLPYARNARMHSEAQVAQIAASIREYGWTIPALVDEAGTLIAGHGRVLAARQLGIEEIPTMIAVGWTEAQIKAYRLADNKLGLNADWDASLLKLELQDLRELQADLSLTGFTGLELNDIFAETTPPDEFGTYDEDVDTEHECPRCHYRWSGKADPSAEAAE
jgi:ParB-like chromosome segregation protein Spo0J